MDERQRLRIEAELTPRRQAALEEFCGAFGVDWRATERPFRVLIEDAILLDLIQHYLSQGYTGPAAARLAGDDIGIGADAVKQRYYRSLRPQLSEAA